MPEIELIELDKAFSCYGIATEGAVHELKAIYAEMFAENTYLQNGVTIPEGEFVVDVGANVGIFSLFVKSLRPRARILAFEPMFHNLLALHKNLQLHNATDVEVVPHGLSGAHEGTATFTFYPNLPGNSTRNRQARNATAMPSPMPGATPSATNCTEERRSRSRLSACPRPWPAIPALNASIC